MVACAPSTCLTIARLALRGDPGRSQINRLLNPGATTFLTQVDFVYEDLATPLPLTSFGVAQYYQNSSTPIHVDLERAFVRLARIESTNWHHFSYTADPTTTATLLTSIQVTEPSDNPGRLSLPPTTFAYGSSAIPALVPDTSTSLAIDGAYTTDVQSSLPLGGYCLLPTTGCYSFQRSFSLSDWDGDAMPELIRYDKHSLAQVAGFYNNDTADSSLLTLPTPDPAIPDTTIHRYDFNGDGLSDILWQNNLYFGRPNGILAPGHLNTSQLSVLYLRGQTLPNSHPGDQRWTDIHQNILTRPHQDWVDSSGLRYLPGPTKVELPDHRYFEYNKVALSDIDGDGIIDFIVWDGQASTANPALLHYDTAWLIFKGKLNGPYSLEFEAPIFKRVPGRVVGNTSVPAGPYQSRFTEVNRYIENNANDAPITEPDVVRTAQETSFLVDINGDGLPDLPPWLNTQDSDVLMGKSRSYNIDSALWDNEQYHDINGDGLIDIVGFTPSVHQIAVSVSLNTGHGFTQRTVIASFPARSNWRDTVGGFSFVPSEDTTAQRLLYLANTYRSIADSQHSPEMYNFHHTPVETRIKSALRLQPNTSASLLIRADNGIGASTHFAFAKGISFAKAHTPSNRPLLKETWLTVDEATGPSRINEETFDYEDGTLIFNPTEKQFQSIGFKRIWKTEPQLATTIFETSTYSNETLGLPLRRVTFTAAGCPTASSKFRWDSQVPSNHPSILQLYQSESTEQKFLPSPNACTLSNPDHPSDPESYAPASPLAASSLQRLVTLDDFGRYTELYIDPDTTTPNDERRLFRTFASDGTALPQIRSKPSTIDELDASGAYISAARLYYDGQLDAPYQAEPLHHLGPHGLLKYIEHMSISPTNGTLLNPVVKRYHGYNHWGQKLVEVEMSECWGTQTEWSYDNHSISPNGKTIGNGSTAPSSWGSTCLSPPSIPFSTSFTIRPDGQIASSTDRHGSTTQNVYDTLSRLREVRRTSAGASDQLLKTVSHVYTQNSHAVLSTAYDYTVGSRDTQPTTTIYDGLGRKRYVETDLGSDYSAALATTTQYDAYSRPILSIGPAANPSISGNYDIDLLPAFPPDAPASAHGYDHTGASSSIYMSRADDIWLNSPNTAPTTDGSTATVIERSTETISNYGANGLQKATVALKDHLPFNPAIPHHQSANPLVRTIHKDLAGRTIRTVSSGGRTIDYEYDSADRIVATHEHSASGTIETRYEYDSLGRLRMKVSPDSGFELFERDRAGRVTRRTFADVPTVGTPYWTRRIVVEYDIQGRPVQKWTETNCTQKPVDGEPGLPEIWIRDEQIFSQFYYDHIATLPPHLGTVYPGTSDALGHPLAVVDQPNPNWSAACQSPYQLNTGTPGVKWFAYDEDGRPIGEGRQIPGGTNLLEIVDLSNRGTALSSSLLVGGLPGSPYLLNGGTATTLNSYEFSHDSAHRLRTIASTASPLEVWKAQDVTATGLLRRSLRPGGVEEEYGYSQDERRPYFLQAHHVGTGNTYYADYIVKEDALGNIIERVDALHASTYNYSYDDDLQLKQASAVPDTPGPWNFEGESEDFTIGPQYFSREYFYDDLGNSTGFQDLLTGSLTSNNPSQPNSLLAIYRPHTVTSHTVDGVTEHLGWEMGNLTEWGPRVFEYNPEGLLTSLDDGQNQHTFDYDAFGVRYRKIGTTPPGIPTDTIFVNRNIEVSLEHGVPTVIRHSVSRGGAKLSTSEFDASLLPAPGSSSFLRRIHFLSDLNHSIYATMDDVGALLTQHRYHPFGEKGRGDAVSLDPRKHPSQRGNDLGFTGMRRDGESGLYHFGARYYSPELRRFTTPDALIPDPRNPTHFNRYTYIGNNPVNGIDPSGHVASVAASLAFALVTVAVTMATGIADLVENPPESGNTCDDLLRVYLQVDVIPNIAGGISFGSGLLGGAVAGALQPGLGESVAGAVGQATGTVASGVANKLVGMSLTAYHGGQVTDDFAIDAVRLGVSAAVSFVGGLGDMTAGERIVYRAGASLATSFAMKEIQRADANSQSSIDYDRIFLNLALSTASSVVAEVVAVLPPEDSPLYGNVELRMAAEKAAVFTLWAAENAINNSNSSQYIDSPPHDLRAIYQDLDSLGISHTYAGRASRSNEAKKKEEEELRIMSNGQ